MACPNMKPEIENMDQVTLGFCLSDLRLELADAILAIPGRDLRQETSQSVSVCKPHEGPPCFPALLLVTHLDATTQPGPAPEHKFRH